MNWSNVEFHSAYGTRQQLPEATLPEVVFAGHSNVGKSSMINKLCQRKNIARVSSEPGKTSTINFYKVDDRFFISDLPGYGYAKVPKKEKERWADLIEGYLNSDREGISLVIMLIDMRHEPSKEDVEMINFLIDSETPFILALTKSDKLRPNARKKRLEEFKNEIPEFENIHSVPFSSVSGEGLEELRQIMLEVTENGEEALSEG